MNQRLLRNLCIICGVLLLPLTAFPYDQNTVHKAINEAASRQSKNIAAVLVTLGFDNGVDSVVNGKRIFEWVQDGGTFEDEPVWRTRFHFHDPLKPFDDAGLYDIYHSSLVWAQHIVENPWWSWPKARQYYYEALTGANEDLREVRFADTFRALGHVMHLVSDASVPAHARDDGHLLPDEFETWTKKNQQKLSYTGIPINHSIFNQAVDDPLAPVPISALWDIDKYKGDNPEVTMGTSIGLAEYSNANFLTQDTMWTYPHPNRADTDYDRINWLNPEPIDAEDGKIDYRIYIKKKVGEQIDHLAVVDYWLSEYGVYFPNAFSLDEKCWEDYASKLIPRAVGYSAGVLDYFFRGKIELTHPSISSGSITLRAQNITEGKEEMSDGEIKLVVRYSRGGEVYYALADTNTTSIPRGNPVELVFSNVIPSDARDIALQVVYRGKLGKEIDGRWIGEADAVAVGMTPYVLFIVLHKKTGDTTDWWYYDLGKEEGYHRNPNVPLPSKPEIISKWWTCDMNEEKEYYRVTDPAFSLSQGVGCGDECGLVNFKSAQCCEGASSAPNTLDKWFSLPCGGEGEQTTWYGCVGKHVVSCSGCGNGEETVYTPGACNQRSRTSNSSSHCDKGTSWSVAIDQLDEKIEIGPRQNLSGHESETIAQLKSSQCGPYETAKMCCPVCSQDKCQCTWMWFPAFCGTVCEGSMSCEGWHPYEGGGWTSCINRTFDGTDTYGGHYGSRFNGCALFDMVSRSSGYGTMTADVVTKVKVGAVETTFGGSWSSYSAQEGDETINNVQTGWSTRCVTCPKGSGQGKPHKVAHFSFSETSYGVAVWSTVVASDGRFAVLMPKMELTASATSTDGEASGSISGTTTALLRVVDIVDENPVERDFELAEGEKGYSLSGMPSSRDDLGIKPNCWPLDLPLDIELRGLHWYSDDAFLVAFVLKDVFYAYMIKKDTEQGWLATQLTDFEQWVKDNNLKGHLMFLD